MANELGALSGIKVLDLSRVLGGPSCGQILGDHGADVIKIEPPNGDETREWGPPFVQEEDGLLGASSYFTGVNRNKRGMSLDLSKDAGQKILLHLLKDTDVIIENFKAGTMEKWGLGFESVLQTKFPKLIHCRITGFGVDGPLGGFPGYDAAVQAATGLFSVNGPSDSGPTRIGIPVVDLATGMNAVIGICMAIIERQSSGIGQLVDITLYDSGLGLMFPHGANWFLDKKLPKRVGNAHTNVAPYDLFKTKTQSVFLAVGNNGQFRKAVSILGKPELADDPRFSSNKDRNKNREHLTQELQSLMKDKDGTSLNKKFLAAGVPSGPALNVEEALEHPHTKHRNMIFQQGKYTGLGAPIKFSRTPGKLRLCPPRFAADSEEVLRESGFERTEIDQFIESGAVIVNKK